MKNQKAVFEFGDEFMCTQFFDADTQTSGVEVSRNGVHLGSCLIDIPDIEDEEENIKFDNEIINWIVDNDL